MTFIYVVYILTFVSAVVMLFLSVVLMLPSSAISISSTKYSSTLLTFIAGYSQLDSAITGLVFLLFPVVTYLSFAFYRTRLYRHNEEIYSIPKQPVNLELTANAPQNIKSLVADYHLRTFYDPYTNAKAVESCQDYTISGSQVLPGRYSTGDNFARVYNDIELSDHISNIVPSRFPLYVRVYPKHFFLGHQNLQTHRIVNLLLTLVYEFSDFYFKVIEPSILNDSKIYAALSRPLRAFVTSKAKALPTL